MVTAAERRAMTARSRTTMARKPRAVRAQTNGGTALNTGEPPRASTMSRAKVSSVHESGPAAPGPPGAVRDDDEAAEEYSPSLRRASYLTALGSAGPTRELCARTVRWSARSHGRLQLTGPVRGGEYPRAAVSSSRGPMASGAVGHRPLAGGG